MPTLTLSDLWSYCKANREKILRILAVLSIILLMSFVASHYSFAAIQNFIQKYEQFTIVISLTLYAILGATPIPSEPLTIFISSLKGPIYALVIATVGNTLAALVEFYIGGSLGDISDFEKRKKKLPFHLGELPIDSPILLLLGRMLPGFGPKFISIICGVYKIPLFTYIWTTMVSNVVGAAIVAYGGYGLINLF
ncbi:TVP38/TMEM64 family protein [Leptolinea tardivitalis]|uniref:TVP38/TMEM64 family membrane protein n=1 Tax=Leptolinea tardivitalis TaxID=229920 RepID=A0A0P6WNN0_9CHLR|nr:VTT domain-containing protein [Leptolinea tardivitalis]KPL70423.1 hypothetical protein ADM99_14845 [Leptolinea tardivitalis]GAP21998.1 uncharacterized conserved protein [Leptolinea tardivitalis]